MGCPRTPLDELPLPSQLGRTRIGGIDLNKPRIRSTVTAVLALTAAPGGFTVKDLTLKVHAMTGQTDYAIRQAAYDLRKLRPQAPRPRQDDHIRGIPDFDQSAHLLRTGRRPQDMYTIAYIC